MIDEAELERDIREIFVDSCRTVHVKERYWEVSPFNVEQLRPEIEKKVEAEYRERTLKSDEVLDSLDAVAADIQAAGGITRDVYEKHHYALNTVARVMTGTNTTRCQGRQDIEDDSRQSREAPEIYLKHSDRQETWSEYTREANIFGRHGEGTLFSREYSDSGMLIRFRIYNKHDLGCLKTVTVDLDALQRRIPELIEERDKGRIDVGLSFPYDADTFAYEKVAEFNERYGHCLRLNVFNIAGREPKPSLVIEFEEHHRTIAQRFFDLQNNHGVPLDMYADRDEFTTLRRKGISEPIDFDDRKARDMYHPVRHRLDNTADEVNTYLAVGHVPHPDLPVLLKSYVMSRSEGAGTGETTNQ